MFQQLWGGNRANVSSQVKLCTSVLPSLHSSIVALVWEAEEKGREAWKKLQQPQLSRHISAASLPIFTAILIIAWIQVLQQATADSVTSLVISLPAVVSNTNRKLSIPWKWRTFWMLGRTVFICTFPPLSLVSLTRKTQKNSWTR